MLQGNQFVVARSALRVDERKDPEQVAPGARKGHQPVAVPPRAALADEPAQELRPLRRGSPGIRVRPARSRSAREQSRFPSIR